MAKRIDKLAVMSLDFEESIKEVPFDGWQVQHPTGRVEYLHDDEFRSTYFPATQKARTEFQKVVNMNAAT